MIFTINRLERNLIKLCRGQQSELNFSYREDRSNLIKDPRLQEKLPRYLTNCKSSTEFISHIHLYYDTLDKQIDVIKKDFDNLKVALDDTADELSETERNIAIDDGDFLLDEDLIDLDELLNDENFLNEIDRRHEII